MNERQSHSEKDKDFNADNSRRGFLKKLGIIGLGTAATAAGIAVAKEYGEHKAEDIIQSLVNGPKRDISVEGGDTLWGIYGRSGYTDIPADYYIEALKRLNPELETEQLQKNSKITAPWKSAESAE